METRCDFSKGSLTNLAMDDRGRLRLSQGREGCVPAGEFVSEVMKLTPPARVSWVAQWTTPQRWWKHEANPVYSSEKSGAWDSWTNGVSIVPTDGGRKYRMYYAGNRGEGIGFAEASVDDPLHWQEHPASPVLTPRQDNWEGNLINQPRVVKVTETHWRMYYTGWGFDGPGSTWAMGLAESFDGGTTWQRRGDEPILERGTPESPDGGGACVPMVLRVGDRWMMWYTAWQAHPDGHQHIHLCLATSEDGLHWHKHPGNPVLGDDFSDEAARSVTSRCCVRHENGVFHMWYSFAKPHYRIAYAESLDGIHWERSPVSPVLGPSPAPAWDDEMVEYPEVQVVNGTYRLWFSGNRFRSVGYAEGVNEAGVEIFCRTGNTATPDASWSEWRSLEREAVLSEGFAQFRAELRSKNPAYGPALNWILISA